MLYSKIEVMQVILPWIVFQKYYLFYPQQIQHPDPVVIQTTQIQPAADLFCGRDGVQMSAVRILKRS